MGGKFKYSLKTYVQLTKGCVYVCVFVVCDLIYLVFNLFVQFVQYLGSEIPLLSDLSFFWVRLKRIMTLDSENYVVYVGKL